MLMPTPITLPNLTEHEAAYRFKSGDVVVLTTTIYKAHPDPSWLAIRVDTDVVDPKTMQTRVTLEPHVHSCRLSDLAHGTTIEEQIAKAHGYACEAAATYLGGLGGVGAMLVPEPPTGPVTRDRSGAVPKKTTKRKGGA